MVTVELEADVPESRQVTVTLPPGVPTGRVRLTVSAEPAHVVPFRPDDSAVVAERHAFRQMLPDLVRTHFGKYVAVSGGRVVASGERPDHVESEARRSLGTVPLYIGVVHPPPSDEVIRFGGVRVVDGTPG